MKNRLKKIITLLVAMVTISCNAQTAIDKGKIIASDVNVQQDGSKATVSLTLVLDSISLSANQQLFLTPFLEGGDHQRAMFPTVLVNGRNMHYVYRRNGLPTDLADHYDIKQVVRRHNGTVQVISYSDAIDLQPWMVSESTVFYVAIDSCGCGRPGGCGNTQPLPQPFPLPNVEIAVKPLPTFHTAYITPQVSAQPMSVHEGRARVQFEVDRTELHDVPYTCKNGQRIDNRSQLQIIEDSIAYALRDPNVELANINICGYASPESPYMHNEYLATNRSRALAEYIAKRHNLPADRCTFASVPENWTEFRQQVVDAKDISEQQRTDLLQLIDQPVFGVSDYDVKEQKLKTDRRFATLYRTKILPVWFPELRCTKFSISTRLKQMSTEQLAEIFKKTPEKLSLNQMFQVSRLYEEGSDEFYQTFETALRFYADDPTANLNGAVAAIKRGDYSRAVILLAKAGNSPEAENARGIVAAHERNFDAALDHFDAAGDLLEALKNKRLIDQYR